MRKIVNTWTWHLCVCVSPAYHVGWLSVWACPALSRSIWSEFHLSDCKWTACPRDARQLSGSPRKRQAGSERWSQWFNRMKHQEPPSYATSVCLFFSKHFQMKVKRLWLWTIYSWTDGEMWDKKSWPWLQRIFCSIKEYLRTSFHVGYLCEEKWNWIGHFIQEYQEGLIITVIKSCHKDNYSLQKRNCLQYSLYRKCCWSDAFMFIWYRLELRCLNLRWFNA